MTPEQERALALARARRRRAGDQPQLSHPEFDPANVPGQQQEGGGMWDRAGAFIMGMADLPVAGPAMHSAARNIGAGIAAPFSDQSFSEIRDQMGDRQQQVMQENPGTTLAGNLTGAVGVMAPLGATAAGGRLLGVTGSMGARTAMSGLSGAAIAGADTAARGGDVGDVARSAAFGGAVGGAIPVAGALLSAGGRAVADTVGPRVNAVVRPVQEAGRRVGRAISRDRGNTAAPLLNQADEAAARVNQQHLLNVDRGGETTRALARSAANTDPEARAIIERTASDRFASQGQRAQSFISRIMGGATDDLALQDSIRAAAQRANRPAYARAYSSPAAKEMWNEGFEQLMQAPAMRQAARQATSRGANRAAVEGFQPVTNPFVEAGGRVTLRTNADGTIARPTLQFWDQVKRNLDSRIGVAQRAGDRTMASDLQAVRSRLVSMLDDAVPEYQAARQGAARFFGAEDALDAGKKFVNQNRTLPETRRAIGQMSREERQAFAVGFASELRDSIAQTRDRTNVIDRIFGSEQAREKVRLALGPQRYREFEQFVRVENAMDMLRGAMGNSTTARQLQELGLAGGVGVGTGVLTGDWKAAVTTGLLVRGARAAGSKVDQNVMKRVAEMLVSDDPQMIERAAKMAARSPAVAKAIEAMTATVGGMARSTPSLATRERQPLQIDVTRPQ